ncbi:MAG: hypothetical protein Q8O67_14025 [Deltaproteobacteria bacterium]|nr:hypothetical protein [Deltaproteobacteria bacterium]
MAIPPEPIDSVLFDAKAVVVGEVVAIVTEGAPLPKKTPPKKDHKDVGNLAAWQKLSLRVDDVLLAGLDVKKGESLDVLKPEGHYGLPVGAKGPFLLGAAGADGLPVILGRYGPDSYRQEVVEAALKRRT